MCVQLGDGQVDRAALKPALMTAPRAPVGSGFSGDTPRSVAPEPAPSSGARAPLLDCTAHHTHPSCERASLHDEIQLACNNTAEIERRAMAGAAECPVPRASVRLLCRPF